MAKNSTVFGQERKFSDQAPAIVSGGGIPTIQFSTGNAKALADFSRTMFGMASQFEDQLDAQAEAEASKAGAVAGLAGDVQEQTYETIRGRAYNKAMLETFVTSFDTETLVGLERLKQQHWADPLGLETAANDYLNGKAAELDKTAPGAGASFRARQTARLLPAVEGARDDRFRLTVDQANAQLIQSEAAILGSIKNNSTDLFSDNPARAAASSGALMQSVSDYMRTYDAVDPVTGKPLFSETDKAKARVYIRDKSMTEATLSWFDQQPDKTEAYLKMIAGDFKFNVQTPGEKPANVVYENKGKTRDKPVTADVMQKLSLVGGSLGPGVTVHIVSGGQPSLREIYQARARGENIGGRTGSDRHDHGNSADVVLSVNGKRVTPDQDPALYKQFAENAAAAGFTGVGHYGWGMHVGGGSVAAWGPNTKGNTLNPEYEAAISRGRQRGKLELAQPTQSTLELKTALSETAWNSLDAEMRQRIGFENSQADRAQRIEAATMKANSDAAEVEVVSRIYSAGTNDPATGQPIKEITVPEVLELSRTGIIGTDQARAFIKAIETEAPDISDNATYQDLQERLYNGEDVHAEILARVDRLSKQDVKTLLDKNNERNVQGAGRLSVEEQRGLDGLTELIRPSSFMSTMDEGRFARAYEAEDEYVRRVKNRSQTGETVQEITRDIAARATMDLARTSFGILDRLIEPRFAVRTEPGRPISIQATAKALQDALAQKKISREEAAEQGRLLRQWDEMQKQVERDDRAAAAEKGKK